MLIRSAATFAGTLPPLDAIVDAISQLTGLPVTTEQSEPDPLYLLDVRLQLTHFPETRITLQAYRHDRIQSDFDQRFADLPTSAKDKIRNNFVGLNERPGTQDVEIEAYFGQEMILFIAAELALEQLGATLAQPTPEEMLANFKPVNIIEFEERLWQNTRQGLRAGFWSTLAAIPFHFRATWNLDLTRSSNTAARVLSQLGNSKPQPLSRLALLSVRLSMISLAFSHAASSLAWLAMYPYTVAKTYRARHRRRKMLREISKNEHDDVPRR